MCGKASLSNSVCVRGVESRGKLLAAWLAVGLAAWLAAGLARAHFKRNRLMFVRGQFCCSAISF